jgi:hypothetical protein
MSRTTSTVILSGTQIRRTVRNVRLTSTPGNRLTEQRQVRLFDLEEPAMDDFRVLLVRDCALAAYRMFVRVSE